MDSRTIFRLIRSSKSSSYAYSEQRILKSLNTVTNCPLRLPTFPTVQRRSFSSRIEGDDQGTNTAFDHSLTDNIRGSNASSASLTIQDTATLSSSVTSTLGTTNISSSGGSTIDEAPTSTVLEELARQTPGTSLYQSFQYDATSVDHPYPIWWLDPTGPIYKLVLGIARTSSTILENIHDISSLPWWITILSTGAIIRLSILPLNIFSLRNASRAVKAQMDLVTIRKAYLQAVSTLSRHNTQVSERIQLLLATVRGSQAALHRANCYPWRTFAIPFIQVPFVIAGVLGARHAVLLGDTRFETEGAFWFTDLTIPDPYYVLPMVSLSLAYLSVDIIFGGKSLIMRPSKLLENSPKPVTDSSSTGVTSAATVKPVGSTVLLGGKLSDVLKNMMQITIIFSAPFLSELPAGLYLLMSANSIWTIAYLAFVRHPTVYQKLVGGNTVHGSTSSASSSSFPPAASAPVQPSATAFVTSTGTMASVVPNASSSVVSRFGLPNVSGNVSSSSLVFPTASSLSAADLQEILLNPRTGSSSSRLSEPSITPSNNQHPVYSNKGLDGIIFYKFNGASHEFHTKTDVVLRSTVSPSALHVATNSAAAPVTATAASVVPTPAISSVSSSSVLTHTVVDNLKQVSPTASLSGTSVPVTVRKSILDNDSSAYLQSLPRLLYVDKVTTYTEEAALMRTLFRTFNVAFPIMHGHPNPLLFQIAGGAYRAPWAFIPIRPWSDNNNSGRSNAVTTAVKEIPVKAEGTTDGTVTKEDTVSTGASSSPVKDETMVNNLAVLQLQHDPQDWRTKESLLIAFRNQWAYGFPIAVRQRRVSGNSLTNVPVVKHVVINPYMFGLPTYDTWNKGTSNHPSSSRSDTMNESDVSGNERKQETGRRQKRHQKLRRSLRLSGNTWNIQLSLRDLIEQSAWETMLSSSSSVGTEGNRKDSLPTETSSGTAVITNTTEGTEFTRLYYYPSRRKYSPYDKGLGYQCCSFALAGLRLHYQWFISHRKRKVNLPPIILAGEPFMYSTLQITPTLYPVKHTPDDSSLLYSSRKNDSVQENFIGPNTFTVTGHGKEESLVTMSKRYQAILNATPGIFTVPSIDDTDSSAYSTGSSPKTGGSTNGFRSASSPSGIGLSITRHSSINPQRFGERSWLPFAREQYHYPTLSNNNSKKNNSNKLPPGSASSSLPGSTVMDTETLEFTSNETLTNEFLGNIESSLSKYFQSKSR